MNRGVVTGTFTVALCPLAGCRVELRPGLAMCGGHWKLLPAAMRAEYLRDSRHSDPATREKALNRVVASVRARLAAQGGRERWARGEPLQLRGKVKGRKGL